MPPVHIAIIQPPGYVHSLGFVDHARYFRHQFRRLGATVSLAKNRLRDDAVNFVFGAHLGFPPEWARRASCVFVNLEQLGVDGATVDPAYLNLLRNGAVVDYHAENVPAYAVNPHEVPLVPFLYAPYLHNAGAVALEDRPIDLLFFGSMNERRRAFIERVEACGVQVAAFDHPLYGAERDHFLGQAKAVLNCHFYDTARFEQARAFHCLSLGTPIISERTARTQAPQGFESSVFWLDGPDAVQRFFSAEFGTPAFFDQARQKLNEFARQDALEAYADLLAFGVSYAQTLQQRRASGPWVPTKMNLGSGKDYKPGWLNVDILERAEPDVVLDLGQAQAFPLQLSGCRGAEVVLQAGQFETVYANNVLEHVPDLPQLMSNVLELLQVGGTFEIEVPYEHAATAWQDPTHLRALNEQSWLYYTDWFWYLGWFEHRFDLSAFQWLDLQLQPCEQAQAAFMKLNLTKVVTSWRERTVARTMQSNFGGVPDDLDDALALSDAPSESVAEAAPKRMSTDDAFAVLLKP